MVLVLAAAVYGYTALRKSDATTKPSDGKADRAIPVVAATAHIADLPLYLNGLGTVTPLNSVILHTRVDGELQSVDFVEGKFVHEGDVLAQIDPRPFQVQLAQAEGQLAKDHSVLQNAQLELDRYKQAADAIPKQQIDTQQAVVDQAVGAIKIDQGQIDSAKLQLTYARIVAPISGRIGLRTVDQGNIVHANDANGLAVITQLQPINVVFSVSEDDLSPVISRPNGGVGLTVEAYDRNLVNKLDVGTVSAIDNAVDPATGTVRVKAILPNAKQNLFANQFVNARLLIDTLHNVVLVPSAAIQRGRDVPFVYVVKPDQSVEVRNVELGASEADQIVIHKGVASGETVVTDGVDKLTNGTHVSVKLAQGRGSPTSGPTSAPASRPTSGSAGGHSATPRSSPVSNPTGGE